MTVATDTNKAGPYATNGATTVFPFSFPIIAAEDLNVYLRDAETGAEDLLALTTDYTVSFTSGVSGGSVASTSILASGYEVVIVREVELTQELDLDNSGGWFPDAHEAAYDKLTMADQQLQEQITRCVHIPASEATDVTLPSSVDRALSLLGFDVNGKPIAAGALPENANAALVTSTGSTNPRSLADRFSDYTNVKDFGAVGDGVTNDTAALTAAEAQSAGKVHVPAGTYYTPSFSPSKTYVGEGCLRVGAAKYPSTYGFIPPTTELQTSGADYWSGDHSRVNSEYWKNMANRVRPPGYVDFPYFNASTTPYYSVYDNYAGNSGLQMGIVSPVAIGAGSVTVSTTAGLTPGQVIRLFGANGSEIKTITTIVGSVVSFTPVTTLAYPTAGGWVSISDRTDNSFKHAMVNNYGGGDCYGHVFRIVNSYVPAPGQLDFYTTATCGLFSGDVFGNSHGVYIQNSEVRLTDESFGGPYDIACIAEVRTLDRNNDTGARGVVWIGNLYQSDGSKAVNAHMSATGKFLRGLDYGSPWIDFGVDQAAINLRANHRIYFNSPSTVDSYDRALWGNAVGHDYMTHDGAQFKLMCANAGASVAGMTLSATGFSVRGDASLQGCVSFASGSVGGTTLLQMTATAGGSALPATVWRFLRVKIDGSGTWYKIPLYND